MESHSIFISQTNDIALGQGVTLTNEDDDGYWTWMKNGCNSKVWKSQIVKMYKRGARYIGTLRRMILR